MYDDLTKPVRVACSIDPGLDRDAMAGEAWADYLDTRRQELVRELPGHAIRWAILRPLRPAEVAGADALPGSTMGASVSLNTAMFAFRCACVRIENFMQPGVALEPTGHLSKTDGVESRFWTDKDLEHVKNGLGMAYVHEIGQFAYQRAMAGNFLSGGVAYTLPLSSTRVLDQMQLRRAELQKRSGTTRSSERSVVESTLPQP